MFSGVFFGPPEGCNGEFYNNRKQADSTILANPQPNDVQLKKYRNSYPSGIIGLTEDRPGVQKDPKM